jgi:hypothetical protein
MFGDSGIDNVFSQYPVVDRVQQINPGNRGTRKKKSEEDSEKEKKNKKESSIVDKLEISDKESLADGTYSTSLGKDDSEDNTSREPGDRLDLVV